MKINDKWTERATSAVINDLMDSLNWEEPSNKKGLVNSGVLQEQSEREYNVTLPLWIWDKLYSLLDAEAKRVNSLNQSEVKVKDITLAFVANEFKKEVRKSYKKQNKIK